MANYCRRCGHSLTSDSNFCEKCGTRTTENVRYDASVPGRTDCNMSFIFGIIGLAASAAVLVCMIALSFNWNNFFIGVVIAWMIISIVPNLMSFGFSNSAQKAGNNSEKLKKARSFHGWGLIFSFIQIFMFIILVAFH